jgi:GT2 family glycosyltransferase
VTDEATVTVAVATFGGSEWIRLANQRALPSARDLGVPTVHAHASTLHDARNAALAQVATEWVVHLDADDELEPGYIKAMATGTADVRAPAVRYIQGNHASPPAVPHVAGHDHHDCVAECLAYGNWLVVGSMVRAGLVREVGGWRDFTWSEDWDLWLRCHLAGATFQAIPAAIYRAHVRRNSRNRSASRAARLAAHRAIAAANGVPIP